MSTAEIEALGLKPLQPLLALVDKVTDGPSLRDCLADLHRRGIGAFFELSADQDPDDSSRVIADVAQGGLGLPDRDYYLKDDARSKELRAAYQGHVMRMLVLLGEPVARATADAAVVVDIERRLATASLTRVQCRDPKNLVHKKSPLQLAALTPSFDWPAYFARVGAPTPEVVNVEQPAFAAAFEALIATEPVENLRTYLRWHVLTSVARYLPQRFVDEDFAFRDKTLTGARSLAPRWKRVVRASDQLLGDALAQGFVKRAFSPRSKRRVLGMVANLEAVLRDDLAALPWMGDTTRKEALAKLAAFRKKIGYPDRWRSYKGLRINAHDYLGNVLRARAHEVARRLHTIGKPTDRAEWHMTAPTVNAYYNPSVNEIVFPAGILQPPFYDEQADDAINYGAIGAVIGHEMTHGFDDQGAQFDAVGNLRSWWAPQDLAAFKARAEAVVRQFDAYEVEPGLHINGKLVVGESIADLGGLVLAYRALQRSLEAQAVAARRGHGASKQGNATKPDPRTRLIDGFTPQQRFFLGWAQIWAINMRPEYVRLQVATDPHPMARFRVNGPLSNLREFAEAFGARDGSPMVRPADKRCGLW